VGSQTASLPDKVMPSPGCTTTGLPTPSRGPMPLATGRGKAWMKFSSAVNFPQAQETEMTQPASEQVKQQLHKRGIVQARFCSCPLTWHLHDDSHGQHRALYLNRMNFSILEIVCTSNE